LNWGPWRNPILSPCKGLTDFSDVLTELDDWPELCSGQAGNKSWIGSDTSRMATMAYYRVKDAMA
jgi:hypothetical protein